MSEVTKLHYRVINHLNKIEDTFDAHISNDDISQFGNKGFLHRKSFIDQNLLGELRTALDEVAVEEIKHSSKEYYSDSGLFIRMLMYKHPTFLNLALNPRIISVVKAMMGPQLSLRDVIGKVTNLESKDLQVMWHIHLRVVPDPIPPFFTPPNGIDALIYLDDIDDNNGALCVLPGSHKEYHLDIPYLDYSDKKNQETIYANAGDCIFIHSNLWHKVTLAKTQSTGKTRKMLGVGFLPAWVKNAFAEDVKAHPEVERMLTEQAENQQIKELLGNFKWR